MPTPPKEPHGSATDRVVILIADDVGWYRQALRQALRRECGLESLEAEDALHALRVLERHPEIALVVADERYESGPSGEMLLETVGRRWPGKARLLLSAYTTGAMVALGAERGYEVLDKQLDWPDLVDRICRLVRR